MNDTIVFSHQIRAPHSNVQLVYMYIRDNTIEVLRNICLAVLLYLIVSLLVYRCLFRRQHCSNNVRQRRRKLLKDVKLPKCERVLIVTAHPEDEAIYFGPTILTLTQQYGCQVYLLCLSSGSCDIKGIQPKPQRHELWNSCKVLCIPDENITLCYYTQLPADNAQDGNWKVDVVGNKILNMLNILDIQLVITYDREGVTLHPHHCSIYYAMVAMCLAGSLPDDCRIFTLETINICRKYMSIFDVIISLMLSTNWCILSWADRRIVLSAMRKHTAGHTWWRRISKTFSRYLIVNSLREMTLSDVELEMQIHDDIT